MHEYKRFACVVKNDGKKGTDCKSAPAGNTNTRVANARERGLQIRASLGNLRGLGEKLRGLRVKLAFKN